MAQCIPYQCAASPKRKAASSYLPQARRIWNKPVLAGPIHKSRPISGPRGTSELIREDRGRESYIDNRSIWSIVMQYMEYFERYMGTMGNGSHGDTHASRQLQRTG